MYRIQCFHAIVSRHENIESNLKLNFVNQSYLVLNLIKNIELNQWTRWKSWTGSLTMKDQIWASGYHTVTKSRWKIQFLLHPPPSQNKKLHPCDITLYQDVYINNNKSTSIKELNMFISSARKLISLKKDKEKNLTSYLHSRRRCNIYLYYECNEA